jgi:small subunit ribosomal protein S8
MFGMMVSDPIADMLTRIRNAVMVGHPAVALPNSKMKTAIAKILKEEGYISGYEVVDGTIPAQKILRIRLKYMGERRERRPVITQLERVSRPGRRVYAGKDDIPWVLSGMGIAILSTPKGVMTGARARQMGVGGEVICKIW